MQVSCPKNGPAVPVPAPCFVTVILLAILVCNNRLPLEAESAALGAALQAAAVHSKVPVGQYVQQNQPPVSDKVGIGVQLASAMRCSATIF